MWDFKIKILNLNITETSTNEKMHALLINNLTNASMHVTLLYISTYTAACKARYKVAVQIVCFFVNHFHFCIKIKFLFLFS